MVNKKITVIYRCHCPRTRRGFQQRVGESSDKFLKMFLFVYYILKTEFQTFVLTFLPSILWHFLHAFKAINTNWFYFEDSFKILIFFCQNFVCLRKTNYPLNMALTLLLYCNSRFKLNVAVVKSILIWSLSS